MFLFWERKQRTKKPKNVRNESKERMKIEMWSEMNVVGERRRRRRSIKGGGGDDGVKMQLESEEHREHCPERTDERNGPTAGLSKKLSRDRERGEKNGEPPAGHNLSGPSSGRAPIVLSFPGVIITTSTVRIVGHLDCLT